MKQLILFILLSFFIVPGCTFLGAGDAFEEDSYGDDEFSEEDEGFGEEDEYSDEEDEEFEEEDGDEKKEGGLKGFFSRLFSSSDEEDSEFLEEEEDSDLEEDEDYADYEDGDEEGKEDTDSQAEMKSSNEEDEDYAKTAESTELETEVATAKPSIIPLNKIRSTSYRKAGYLVNAVYIARPNETLKNVSQKIYGSNQVSALYAINPHLQSRSIKVGDKIYYNSPLRKEDSSRLLFYYQDINAPSSFHTLSPGDNIRKVSSQILGHPNSWKEIWATNPELESKGEITSSISIVFWPVASSLVSAPITPPVSEDNMAQKDESFTQEVPDPVEPQPIQDKAFGAEGAFPPVAEVDQEPKKGQSGSILEIMLQDKKILLALLGIIIGLILMIRLILKKRKQRDFDYTATNIEV